MQIFEKHKNMWCFFLGSMAVCALPPFYIFPLLVVALSFFMTFLQRAESKKSAFALGYAFGFGFFSAGLSWIINAVMIEPEETGWLAPVIYLASGAFFGLFCAFPALFSFKFKNIYAKIIVFAASWTIFEWIRSFFLTGFPWNLLGTSLAFSNELIQFASVCGTYGLSFLVVLFCCMPVALKKNLKSFLIVALVMSAIAVGIFSFGYYRLGKADKEPTEYKVRIVQPSIPQRLKWSRDSVAQNFAKYVEMSAQEGKDSVDFVVWGETASPYNPKVLPEYVGEFMKAVPQDGYLLFGVLDYELLQGDYLHKNSMLAMNSSGEVVDSYDKMHLVPFGEYIPFRKYLPDAIRPVTNIIGEFKAGEEHKVIKLSDNKPAFGALICYEIIFPAEITDAQNRPEWIALLTNDGWYGMSMGPYQHFVAARMRAAEEGLPIIRSANSGISGIIDSYGRTVQKLDLYEDNILDGYIPKAIAPTIYSQFSNILVLVICLVLMLVILLLSYYIKED